MSDFLHHVQLEVNDRELAALKAVLKCIEEHKLEDQYPAGLIRKQVLELEKAKAEKKKVNEVTKPQPKRPCANTAANGHPAWSSASEKPFYPRVNERYPPHVYERPYVYHPENHGPLLVGPPATHNPPPGHCKAFGNIFHYQAPPYLH